MFETEKTFGYQVELGLTSKAGATLCKFCDQGNTLVVLGDRTP